MRRFALALAAACSVVGAWAVADADPKRPQPVADASAQSLERTLPMGDPPPLSEKKQWLLDLRWERGDPYLVSVRSFELPAPRSTPRAMGRFALELFEGPTLVERVRFDFPLLLPPTEDGGPSELTAKLRTRIGVVFPTTARGTRLQLVDRATEDRWELPWPIQESLSDAGLSDASTRKMERPSPP